MSAQFAAAVTRIIAAFGLVLLAPFVGGLFDDVEVTANGLVQVAMVVVAVTVTPPLGRLRFRPARLPEQGVGVAVPASKEDEEPGNLVARAVHEAGHALVAHVLGHELDEVSVAAHPGTGGRTVWMHRDSAGHSVDHMSVAYAGALAERLVAPDGIRTSSRDDFVRLQNLALSVSVTDPEERTPSAITSQAISVARRIVSAYPEAVSALAAELIGEEAIPGDRAHAIFREHDAIPEVRPALPREARRENTGSEAAAHSISPARDKRSASVTESAEREKRIR